MKAEIGSGRRKEGRERANGSQASLPPFTIPHTDLPPEGEEGGKGGRKLTMMTAAYTPPLPPPPAANLAVSQIKMEKNSSLKNPYNDLVPFDKCISKEKGGRGIFFLRET